MQKLIDSECFEAYVDDLASRQRISRQLADAVLTEVWLPLSALSHGRLPPPYAGPSPSMSNGFLMQWVFAGAWVEIELAQQPDEGPITASLLIKIPPDDYSSLEDLPVADVVAGCGRTLAEMYCSA